MQRQLQRSQREDVRLLCTDLWPGYCETSTTGAVWLISAQNQAFPDMELSAFGLLCLVPIYRRPVASSKATETSTIRAKGLRTVIDNLCMRV